MSRLLLPFLMGLQLLAQAPLKLPEATPSEMPLGQALKLRRTERGLAGPALALPELARLLWAAQGENRPGKRTVPSANARYPLELYLIHGGSPTLAVGTYLYLPKEHALRKVGDKGPSGLLGPIKGMQTWLAESPEVFFFVGVPGRMAGKDPQKQEAYTFWEAGAATQALLLQATALNLGSGVASGVDLEAIKAALALPAEQKPIVLVPVGKAK